ncbi:MAG: hypothetical protein OSA84_11335 [Akkermansiaceae bacterium]|nr:hypothetical protein [Akkermansiaceae bacterium]
MTRETAIQIACLYGPLAATALLIWWFRPGKRLATGLLYSTAWVAAPLQRLTWHHPPSGRTESGIAGVSMAFQHLHLGWAALGWIAGIPGISHTIQLCFDTAGAGKKPLESA